MLKRPVVLGSAEDLLLSPGPCVCDKTWRGDDFISLESGKIFHVIIDPAPGIDPALYCRLIRVKLF